MSTGKPVGWVAAGALLLAGVGVGAAHAAGPPSAITLVAATRTITAERWAAGGDVVLSFDLGLHVIAGSDPFEVRARRAGYDKPILAYRIVTAAGKKTRVPLPSGTVSTLDGLKDFTTITVTNGSGRVVATYRTSFCGNSWASARTRRDAPATSPYPVRCGGENPFALGGVWGVQAGWNAAVPDQPPASRRLRLAAGKYQVTATVNPKFRRVFGISLKDGTAEVTMNVVDVRADPRAGAAKATAAAPAHPQHTAPLRAAVKVPAVLAITPKGGPKPNLRSLPAWGISAERAGKRWYVTFGATVWNAGTSPLLVDGFRRSGTDLMDTYQYFFDANGRQVGSRPAGTMEWDDRAGHQHWHFTDFARYSLLRAGKQVAVRSGKQAFCLANTDVVDYSIAGAKWRPENTDLATSCGAHTAVAVREVLDVGNGDTYGQDRPGQSFDVTNLPNGIYHIQVVANPAQRLSESSTTDNTALRKIILGGTAAQRTVTVPAVHGIKG